MRVEMERVLAGSKMLRVNRTSAPGGHYDSSLPRMDDIQSQIFDSGGDGGGFSAGDYTRECSWNGGDGVKSSDLRHGLTFQCEYILDSIASNTSCWVTSVSDCISNDESQIGDSFNGTSADPALAGSDRTQVCLSCFSDNATSFWALRSSSRPGLLSSLFAYGSELLCSLESCSSVPCDNSTISPMAPFASPFLSPPANSSAHHASSPSVSYTLPTLTLPSSLHALHCRIPELLPTDPSLPQAPNLTHDARYLDVNATFAGEEAFEYDFSFLFLAMFILAGGIGNILVCLAVSRPASALVCCAVFIFLFIH